MSERDFLLEFADESNRIEGQPIARAELERSYAADALDGHPAVLRAALIQAEVGVPLTHRDLHAWQAALVREQARHGYEQMPPAYVGAYRPHGVEVRIAGRLGLASDRVASAMARHLDALNGPWNGDPLAHVARLHVEYEHIHPYADGNGRTGRALVLYALRRLGAPAVLFTAEDRFVTYYPAFADTSGGEMATYLRARTHAWVSGDPIAPGAEPG